MNFDIWGMGASLTCEDPTDEARAADIFKDVTSRIDLAVNRFRPDSELSRLNAEPGVAHHVSDTFAQVLDAALLGARITEGLCTPTVLGALLAQGYDRDFDELTHDIVSPTPAHAAPGLENLSYDPAARTLRIAPGCLLDFGATAKALAADLIAERLGGHGVCVEIGGDVAVRARRDGQPWVIGIADSERVGPDTPRIGLNHGGVATSSTLWRSWRTSDGGRRHHIIDPRTGTSATGPVVTASVSASSAVIANAFATAALIWGADAGFHVAQAGWSGRLVHADGVVDYVGGWPAEGEEQ